VNYRCFHRVDNAPALLIFKYRSRAVGKRCHHTALLDDMEMRAARLAAA